MTAEGQSSDCGVPRRSEHVATEACDNARMPEPIAICVEDLAPVDVNDRFVRCVAKVGRGDGLALDPAARPVFGKQTNAACELVVSLDQRLLLIRHEGAPTVTVFRAGRSLEAAVGHLVLLVDQDEVQVGDKRVRIHIHGLSPEVHAPKPFVPKAVKTAVSMAAVMALAATGCDQTSSLLDSKPIEVREHPPAPPPRDAAPAISAPTPPATNSVKLPREE